MALVDRRAAPDRRRSATASLGLVLTLGLVLAVGLVAPRATDARPTGPLNCTLFTQAAAQLHMDPDELCEIVELPCYRPQGYCDERIEKVLAAAEEVGKRTEESVYLAPWPSSPIHAANLVLHASGWCSATSCLLPGGEDTWITPPFTWPLLRLLGYPNFCMIALQCAVATSALLLARWLLERAVLRPFGLRHGLASKRVYRARTIPPLMAAYLRCRRPDSHMVRPCWRAPCGRPHVELRLARPARSGCSADAPRCFATDRPVGCQGGNAAATSRALVPRSPQRRQAE